MDQKSLDIIACCVQGFLKDGPKTYLAVRDAVAIEFGFGKTKTGNVLGILSDRRNFLYLTFGVRRLWNGVLYLPEHSDDARKLFRAIIESVPYPIRCARGHSHKILLAEARKIKLQNQELPAHLLLEVVKWKLKVSENTAKNMLDELENM